MTEEEWVKAAMIDDSMVVELLLRLNHAEPPPKPKASLPLDWTVRQRRSKPVAVCTKKSAPRASPTTPLSWSGATSVSGGGGGSGGAVDGGSEECSHPPSSISKPSGTARSKVNGTSETTNIITTKRSRRKKTLAELKEEEMLLLKERRQLKKELATLRSNLEKQRANNVNLKRMKLDLQAQPLNEESRIVPSDGAMSDLFPQKTTVCSAAPSILQPTPVANDALLKSCDPNNSCEGHKEAADHEDKFVLPDLNLPLEEDSNAEVLCGVS